MVIIQTNEDLYQYLMHVVKEYANSGIDPEEGLAMYKLWQALRNAQQIDDKKLANTQGPFTMSSVTDLKPETEEDHPTNPAG